MDSDTQVRMFYPSQDRSADDGRSTSRQLYIRTTKVMAFATKASLHLEPMPVAE